MSRRNEVPRRRLLAVLFTAGAAVTCAGCSGGSSGSGEPGAKRPEPAPDASGRAPVLPGEDAALARARERMVHELESIGPNDNPITSRRVLEALRRVPRHEFVPEELRAKSYENYPLPIPENQTISQPYIVALMTQLLDLKGGERVLEIGTGSGYQAAILGELAAEVYTVEIRPALLEAAKKTLERLKAQGVLHYKNLVAVVGDGWKGYDPGAPYDAIVVTAAPKTIPVDLLNQLKPGGRLVVPVGDFFQELQLVEKDLESKLHEKPIVPVRFVPMVGEGKK